MSFSLDLAEIIAKELVKNLAPHCERIEIAGSIRRRRPEVKDIDLVVIPKMTSKAALFETVSEVADTDFAEAMRWILCPLVAEGPRLMRGRTGGAENISVDVYIATEETWATLLLIRTGSAEHNIWMCMRARACGGKLHADGSGLEVPGQYDAVLQRTVNSKVIRATSEEEIFKALGIPMPSPEGREIVHGKPLWMVAR